MHHDDGGAVACNGFAEDLGNSQYGSVDGSDIDGWNRYYTARNIQQDHPNVFLLQMTHIGYQPGSILSFFNRRTLVGVGNHQPPAQFKGGQYLCYLRCSEAFESRQFGI